MENLKTFAVTLSSEKIIYVKASSFYADTHGVRFITKNGNESTSDVAFFPYDKVMAVVEEKSIAK